MIKILVQLRDENTRSLIKIFSNFKSLIWTERFKDLGDCELIVPLTVMNANYFKLERYLMLQDSLTLMIIDTITLDSEEKEITVIGHAVETVLYRRIWHTWNTEIGTLPKHTITECFKKVMEDTFIKSIGNPKGLVDYIKYNTENGDYPSEDIMLIKNHYPQRGDGIGEYIYTFASVFNFGIRSEFDQDTKNITFYLYDGIERPNVIFGEANFNFNGSRLITSTQELKTTAMVAGEGEASSRKIVTVAKSTNVYSVDGELVESNVEYTGIKQREMFVDARDIQKQSGESNDSYIKRLKQKGSDTLFVNNLSETIDGKILNIGKYKLNQDYSLGDIVTIKDQFFTAKVKITEIIRSWNQTGYNIYPSFEVISLINSTEIIETNIV